MKLRGVPVRDPAAEFVFERHDQLLHVKRREVPKKRRIIRDLGLGDALMGRDDSPDPFGDRGFVVCYRQCSLLCSKNDHILFFVSYPTVSVFLVLRAGFRLFGRAHIDEPLLEHPRRATLNALILFGRIVIVFIYSKAGIKLLYFFDFHVRIIMLFYKIQKNFDLI